MIFFNLFFYNLFKNLIINKMHIIRPDSYPQSESPSSDHQFGSYKDETSVGANDGTGLFKDQVMDLFQPWANLFTKHSITPSNVKEKASVSQVTEALDAELNLTAGNVDTMDTNGTYTVDFDNKNGVLLLEAPLTAVTISPGASVSEGNRLLVQNNTGGSVTVTAGVAIVLADNERVALFYNTHLAAYVTTLGNNVFFGTLKNLSVVDSTTKDTGSIVLEGGIGVEKNIHAGGTIKSDNTNDATNKDSGAIVVEGGIGVEKNLVTGGGIGRGSTAILKEKIVDIGDWDMDATATKTVAHGLSDFKKIRSISVIIRNDTDDTYRTLERYEDLADPDLVGGGVYQFSGTLITLKRRTGGVFDATEFDSTSYNRGWVYILYEI